MISGNMRIAAIKGQVSTDLGDEVVILNLRDGVYYGLDPVGALVWNLVQEPQTVHQIRDAILQEYDVEPDRCEQDLVALLQSLKENGLIEVQDEVAS